ncbi:triacylglycerol lipase [Curtobacterium sp. MCBD17_013]|uniref:esterase/lipase family protein n=1 Tax=Curtobacterium sp. MCBD17_013 TaxID=2175668 RepID=UPI0021AD1055|nr:alpha/beta hydrolase [Curtobacterium sp. MCBD17_013]
MTGATGWRDREARSTPDPPPRLAVHLRNARWFLLDWWYAAVWQLRSLGPTTADDYRSGDRQPIVVVPGVYETWHFMRPLMDALHDHGHPVFVVTALRHNRQSVRAGARLVMDQIRAEDLHDVLLVTHSKGGLIGKYAMTLLDGGGRVDRMVAVSAPFGGSSYARFAPNTTLRAFSVHDPTLAALLADVHANGRITSVYGVFDTMIPEGSALVGAKNERLPVGGHFRILSDPRTYRAVLDAVDPAVSSEPQ